LFFLAPTDVSVARFGTSTVSFRERNLETIDELERSSLDLYAATRTLVRQLRANEIRNGAPAPIEDIYDEDLYTLDEDVGGDLGEPDDPNRDPAGDPYQDPEDDDAQ
jgi:ABC-type transporter lipoprotein component MlaA